MAELTLIILLCSLLYAVYKASIYIYTKKEIAKTEKKLSEKAAELEQLELTLSNRTKEYEHLKESAISDGEKELRETRSSLYKEIGELKKSMSQLTLEESHKRSKIIELDEQILYQDFALYEPQYSFNTVDGYKEELSNIRNKQKLLIKTNEAATGADAWTVNNSKTQGRKMVNDTKKLLLRAFNNECDFAINKVTYANFEQSKKRITSSRESIIKLGRTMSIEISYKYYKLKLAELHLAFEYQQAKQAEKEKLQMIREQEREEAKLRKEIEEKRRSIKKEQAHYNKALDLAKEQLESCSNESEKEQLLEKISSLESSLVKINQNISDLDYRESNQRAGYVYIISNIGSFGENVYKIGMTRRLEPMDRVNELGDASVPFPFDVHALIFSDDAPALENALHRYFENRKVNMINTRREFFRVTLDEIKNVVKDNFDGTVDFINFAKATQYRESLKLYN